MSTKQRTATDIVSDQGEYYVIRLKAISISKQLLRELEAKLPILKQKREYLLFLKSLDQRSICKVTGGVKFSRKRLAKILNRHPNKVRLIDFLEQVKADLLPELEWTEYEYSKGKCTVIVNSGVKDLLDRLAIDIDDERVHIATMKKVTDRSKQQLAKEIKDAAARSAEWRCKDQEIIATYLNNQPYSLFSVGELHFYEVFDMARELDQLIEEKNPNSPQKNHHKNLLMTIRDMWKVFYYPTGRSPRVFGTGTTFLRSELRKELYPHWIDFDLKNCHLAIIAWLFFVPETKAFLESGQSIWKEMARHMGIAEEKVAQAKEFLKVALYSIVFGMTMAEAERELQDELACRGIWWDKTFTSHPIIVEVAGALREARKSIKENGGMNSAYGWMCQEEGEGERGTLARVIQSYELRIISACYKLAIREKASRNNDFEIVLHQHDGFAIVAKPGVSLERIEKKLQAVVEEQAEELGMRMTIEMKN